MADEHFIADETFEAEVNGHVNRYVEGQHYRARDGALWDDLRSKLPGWEAEGKITRVEGPGVRNTSRPFFSGTASVTELAG